MESRFLRPAHYDDNIEIVTIVKEMPTKMITFHHELFNEEKKLLNTATVKLFFIDMKTNNRVSIPDDLREKMAPYF
jgi:acyl-CoA thioester hydrolase